MTTDMSLNEIEEAFSPGEEVTFSIYDDDVEIARYYNKGIASLVVTSKDPRTILVEFNVTQLDETAEDRLQANLDDSDGAIEELAAVVAELADLDLDALAQNASEAASAVGAWGDRITTLEQFIVQLNIIEELTDLKQRLSIAEGQIDDLRFPSRNSPAEVVDENESPSIEE